MKKILKRSIIIIVVIVIILSIIVILLPKENQELEEIKEEAEIQRNIKEKAGMIINGKKPSELKVENIFYTIDNEIRIYMNQVKNSEKTKVYNSLDKDYIAQNNVTEENVLENIPNYIDVDKYRTKKIYELTGRNFATYFVKGIVDEKNIYFVFKLDISNDVFSIFPIEEEVYNKKIDEVVDTDKKEEETIEVNEDNKIVYVSLNEEEIVDKYFQDYLETILNDLSAGYQILNKEYREKRFENVENFAEYVNLNKENLKKMCKSFRKSYENFENIKDFEEYYDEISQKGIQKYSINEYNNIKQYVCIDQNENYYIFNIKGIMDYEVILDTYTIDLPQFLEKYEEGNEQVKVGMNIEKFISAINAKDYKYAYNCLADSFKNNYYQTQESFEDYVKNNFFENNKIEYIQFSKEGNNYVYDIKILNTQGEEEKRATIIMQLQEGTEFVMSFSIE